MADEYDEEVFEDEEEGDADLDLDEDLELADIDTDAEEDDELDDAEADDDEEEELETELEEEGDVDDEGEEESLDVLLSREVEDDLVRLDDEPRDGLAAASPPIGADEFTCQSCFLVKRRAQLADPKRMYCVDCA